MKNQNWKARTLLSEIATKEKRYRALDTMKKFCLGCFIKMEVSKYDTNHLILCKSHV